MSTEVAGVVHSLHEKDWNGTMLYSFKLEGVERFWRLGQKVPEFKIGDSITFTERNSNVDWGSIKPIAKEDVVVVRPGSMLPPAPDVGKRIQHQAARADATRLVVAALHTDALPWTAVQQKNKSKKIDLLLGYIKQVTEQMLEGEEAA